MGIKVVLSEQEAKSEVLKPIPSGVYKVNITDCELRESKSEKNNGKPYYSFELTVADGAYEGRKVFTNVMLWAGAAYSLNQLLNAVGISTEGGQEVDVPEPEAWLGKEIMVKVKITPPRKVGDKEYDERNDVAGFLKQGTSTANATPGKSSLLPS